MAIRHDIHTRIYLNDDWRDVTSDVRVSDGLNITRGRPDEATETLPQTCNFTLDNRTGTYSVRNPSSTWYGYLGRGNPVEVCKYLAQDNASATVTSGWGTTETGTSGALSTYTWTVTGGSAADYAKSAGKATHAVTSTNVRRLSYLAAFSQRDVDVTVTVSVNVTNVTGASITSDVVVRGVSLGGVDQVAARLIINTDESVQLDLVDTNGVSWANGPVTISDITHTSSQALKIRAQVEGQAIRAKVWIATAGEPIGWNYTWVNVAPDATNVAYAVGWVGIGSARTTGNTNGTVTFSYDDFLVVSPRFTGEVVNYQTEGDPSARERRVTVEAAGVIRRLLQGNNPLQSAPRRFIPTDGQGVSEVQFYWPLENGALTEFGQAVIGDVQLNLSSGSPERVFGQGDLAPWLAPAAELQGSDALSTIPDITMTNFVAADGWMFDFVRSEGVQEDTAIQILYGAAGGFDVVFDVSTQQISVVDDVTTTVISYPTAFDGGVHHIRLSAVGSGTIAWDLLVDGVSVGGNAYAGTIDSIFFFVISNGAGPPNIMPVGHVAVYNGTFSSTVNAWDAAFGFRGETAGRRMQRLCDENGIEFTWLGDIDATTPMGPQGVKTLIELLRECAATDQGTLYESKGSVGLVYRTRDHVYSQTPLLTLDASQKQVGYPFEPVEDDQFVVNNVIAQRAYGGEYEVELASGPLSTANPPEGIGRYDIQLDVNAYLDEQLPDIASWRLALGTVDEPRFPGLYLDLDATETRQFEDEILDLTPDDLMVITNASSAGVYETINLLARGYTESWTSHRHTIQLNASPYGPNNVFVLGTSRLDAEGITINEDLDTTETGVGTAIATGNALWNTADLPYVVKISGEQMNVTAVSGASSPQTLTVTRSVNGVVKTHTTGAEVLLAVPYYLGL